MHQFRYLVCTLPGWLGSGVAIAATRCGVAGILDLEGTSSDLAQSAVARLRKYRRGPGGIKLDSGSCLRDPEKVRELAKDFELIILTAASRAGVRDLLPLVRERGVTILLESTSEEEAALGAELGVDGLIAKGNEAGGRVGEETTFVLLQRLLKKFRLPIWAHGGIGLHTVGACFAAGAAGVVLDNQLALTSESNLPTKTRAAIERMEGDETLCLGGALGETYRVYKRPGVAAIDELQRLEQELREQPSAELAQERWREAIWSRVGWSRPESNILPLGQDAAFAKHLAEKFHDVSGIVGALRKSVESHVRAAQNLLLLERGAALARSHKTEYPILQGPMTRVSDTAGFAVAVAEGGALPFLALALMRAPQVRSLLSETKQRLGDRPWGVGILGFVPLDLRTEQLEVVREFRPPYAIIAGGRPDQAASLEREGIAAYLHVPAPGLLQVFLDAGARRFIFEGRECGGHVGPRTSFVLWETMIEVLLEAVENGIPAEELHVVFAGGIHDARSAAMVSTMTAPLAERGVRIGVLMGTAYLFTEEAVRSNAIVEGFRQEAIECTRTVLLDSGPGHSTRCADTPFFRVFQETKRKLIAAGKSSDDIRETLENLNLGRLRIASKGIARDPQDPRDQPRYIKLSPEQQQLEGMYMIGQLAALRNQTCTIRDLHEDVTSGGARLLRDLSLPAELLSKPVDRPAPKPADIAIVGMGCLLPGAKDVKTFWKNVLNKVDSIREIPLERFDHKLYFDADKKAQDKIYSKWGGFLDDIDFDPMRYGIPPAALSSIDPFQLLSLEVVHQALGDAGYLKRDFPHQRTSVIFGLSGGLGNLGLQYSVRSLLPIYFGQVPPELRDRLPEWTEDSFAGLLLNVAPGRVANRFDFGGVNYAVDAACASSLAAVQLAIRELEIGTSDMVVVGGVDTTQNAFGYLCFAKSQALSARGRCSTFDEGADGIAIGEGLVTLVLKRLADAEHDGDRIYAVIKSVAGSSDGRGKGLTAPRPEGQVLALQRAYQQAGVSPASIGLVEAHGTGTVAGDAAEVASLTEVYGAAGAKPASCAIGSVKSMIGHTKASAGVVGLMKVALALYHKVLPPTLNVEMPNAMLRQPDCPFFVNTEPLPWVPASTDVLRRASVSSFGFGGTNFHAVVEEYEGDYGNPADKATTEEWPTELFYWNAASSADLQISLKSLEDSLQGGSALSLRDLAASIYADSQAVTEPGARLAIVASSIGDLLSKIAAVQKALSAGETVVPGVRGVYLGQGRAQLPKLAFLFSGQGSQYPGMLRDLALHFPEIRGSLDVANRIQGFKFPRPLSSYVYPPPAFTPAEREARMQAITDTTIAQPALGAVEVGLVHLLKRLGLRPNITAGHSYGEYVALWAAGVWSDEDLFEISAARGRFIKDSIGENPGAMAAVSATRDQVATVLRGNENVWLANFNAPQQIIIAGEVEELRKAAEVLSSQGLTSRPIPVACAFHTPLMQGARDRLGEFIAVKKFSTPTTEVFSNSLAGPYPKQPTEIGSTLREHLVRPVEFVREIEAMYEAGARVFLEVGPKSVLTALVRQILAGKDALAVPIDVADVHGLIQLQHVLGQIAVLGFPVNLDELFRGRATRIVTLGQISTVKPPAPSAWVVNGAGVRLRSGAALSQQRKALTGFPGQGTTKEEKVVAGTAIPAATPLQPEAPGSGLHGIRPKPSPAPAILREGVPNMESQDSISVPGQANGPEAVLIEFQKLMNQFLQTQESVMRAYLQSGSGDSAMVAPANLLSQTLAADTRVVQDLYQPATKPDPSTPSEAPKTPFDETVQAPAADPAAVRDATGELVGIVSARTGYPPEMLDLDLNLEADLGIDSIKRVEILGAFQKACSTDEQSRIQGAMERLTKRKTLRELAGALSEALRNGNSAISDKALPKAAAGADEPQRKDYTTELVGIVSARTGYPPEMLDLDLNLEADLGIDSIKRVEILGAFQKACSTDEQSRIQGAMERLTKRKTLRELAGAVSEALAGEVRSSEMERASAPASKPVTLVNNDVSSTCLPVPRFTLEIIDASLGANRERSYPKRVCVITDDESGIADHLADALRRSGEQAVILRHLSAISNLPKHTYSADLTNPEKVQQVLDHIRGQYGAIGAVAHLVPLKPSVSFADISFDDWREKVQLEIKSLYALARFAQSDLATLGRDRGATLVAVTGMGGSFAIKPAQNICPSHAGVAAFLKTFSLEAPEILCKAVDFDPTEPAEILAERVRFELASMDKTLEVGYDRGRRVTIVPQFSPLQDDSADSRRPFLDRNSVVLLTGGARGITAEIAFSLATRFQPVLVLAGSSPLADDEETSALSDLIDPGQLRAVILAGMRSVSSTVRPAEVEAECRRVMKQREIRHNLDRFKAAGARVEYHALDVRDENAFSALIEGVYTKYGRIDSVIHGAGIIEDKWIRDKTPDSFDRVVHTKTDSAYILSRKLRPADLKYLVLMSSVTASFGNVGQCDYAAANGVLNGLAAWLSARWPGRVVAMNWGPWDQFGMVSEQVKKQFLDQGVQLIPPSCGAEAVSRELQSGGRSEPVVALGEGPWAKVARQCMEAIREADSALVSEAGTLI